MAIIKYEPFWGWMNKFFDQDFLPSFFDSQSGQIPVDIYEKNDNLIMDFELPGLSKDNIFIELDGDILTVGGKTKKDETINEENYYRKERSYGEFSRSFTLPDSVKEKDISAKFDKGILKISFPKTKKVETKKKIAIQ